MTTHYGRDAKNILTSNCEGYDYIDEGEQRRFNHLDCDAGEDTKTRLYVKKVDEAYLFHCHNCGDSGYYRPRDRLTTIRDKDAAANLNIHTTIPNRHELTKHEDYDNFRVEGQLWLGQYGFTAEMCHAYGIVECDNGLVLPIYTTKDSLHSAVRVVGYQIRNYTRKPKYLTYTTYNYSYLPTLASTGKLVVFTEDLLSSYKLHKAGQASICLLGTKLDYTLLSHIKDRYERQLLWLDDDAAGHSATVKLCKELSPMLPNLTAMFNKQPKELDIDTLMTMEL